MPLPLCLQMSTAMVFFLVEVEQAGRIEGGGWVNNEGRGGGGRRDR